MSTLHGVVLCEKTTEIEPVAEAVKGASSIF